MSGLRAAVWALATVAALCVTAGLAALGAGKPEGLEGSPFRGRTLFVEKRCVQCHSIWGHGGAVGPEITRVVAGKPLPQLTGEFWNHTPRMIDEMVGQGYAWPTLNRQEMADLLSYLYYLRLFDDPGNPVRGATTYARHRCESCHSLGGRGGDIASPLDRYSAYTSPVPLAQAMWNAGPDMQRMQLGRGTPIPEFAGAEMADIQAYIHERGSRRDPGPVELLSQPDPARGEELFRSKRCSACHATGRAGAPDLSEAALRMTVAEISGVLWNHSYAMHGTMRAAGIPFPKFRGAELSDLVSYLHLVGYTGGTGDAAKGAAVFREKGCATCHEQQKIEAPDLAGSHVGDDTIALSAAMWNHAPQMHDLMAEHGVAWPRFDGDDMQNLVAYLRSLASRDKPAD